MNKPLIVFLVILVITVMQAVDIYLPSLPHMASEFHVSNTAIQLTFTSAMIAYAISQMLYGPIADYRGRRLIIVVGMAIFLVGNLICCAALNVMMLYLGRAIMGLGVGAAGAVGPAIPYDIYEKQQVVKAYSYMGISLAVTPIIAPVLGGYLQNYLGWRINFIVLLGYATVVFLLIAAFLPETNPRVKRPLCFRSIVNDYARLCKHREFMILLLLLVLLSGSELAYAVVLPFLIQTKLDYSAVENGWFMIATASGFSVGALIASLTSKVIALPRLIMSALLICLVAALVMLCCALLGYFNAWVILLPLIFFMLGGGLFYPNCIALVMSLFPNNSGVTSAFMGAMQMLGGSILVTLVSILPEDNQIPIASVLTVSMVVSVMIYGYFLLNRKRVHQPINSPPVC